MKKEDNEGSYVDTAIATRGSTPQRLLAYPRAAAGTTLKQMHRGS